MSVFNRQSGLKSRIPGYSYALILWLLTAQTVSVSAQEFNDTSLEPAEIAAYSQVQRLRVELAMSNADLAAMGCTQTQAKALLDSLLAWTKTNLTQLQQADEQVRSTRSQLRQAMQKIHIGPRNQTLIGQVPKLKQNYATALASRQQKYESAVNTLKTSLSAEQIGIWQAARANKEKYARYRYAPGLSQDQSKALRTAIRARNDGAPFDEAVMSREQIMLRKQNFDLGKVEGRVLSASQLSQLSTAKANQQAKMAEVIAAEQEFLPESPEGELEVDLISEEPAASNQQ